MIPFVVLGADHYIDVDASGANNGTSWTDAWDEMDQVSWGSVSAGETIYVSGGTYTNNMRAEASGTAGNPITIKSSNAAEHNDAIVHTGSIGAFGTGNFLVFDGSINDIDSQLTSTFQVKTIVGSGTNSNWNTYGGVFNGEGGCNNITLRWLGIGGNTNGVSDTWGLQWNNGDLSNNVIEYVRFHDIEDSGIVAATGNGTPETWDFDDLTMRWCYLTNSGDDFYEGLEGATIHNNYFDGQAARHGHPDGIAGHMGRMYVYNNILVDVWDQIIYMKMWETYPQDHGEVYFYGNMIWVDQMAVPPKADGIQVGASFGWETGRYTSGTGSQSGTTVTATTGTPFSGNGQTHVGSVVYWASGETATVVSLDSPTTATVTPSQTVASGDFDVTSVPLTNTWDTFVFANNTFVGSDTVSTGQLLNSISFVNTYASGNIFTNRIVVTNAIVKNNLFYKIPQGGGTFKSEAEGFVYDESTLVYDYNIAYSTISAGKVIDYNGTDYATAEALNAATSFGNNSSAQPTLADPINFDFSPDSSDTVAKDAGDDLSGLSLPGWGTDLAGNVRTNDTAPDIGALEYVASDTNLLVWLMFENDPESDGYMTDSSGYARHAVDMSFSGDAYPSSRVTRVAATGMTGGIGSGYAGAFTWQTNSWGIYNKSGSFGAITNDTSALTNLAVATICAWVRYESYTNIVGAADWSADGNATFLGSSPSTGVAGNFSFGRINAYSSVNQTRFAVMTNNLVEPSLVFVDFPDMPTNNLTGDTTNWNHYAVTFSSGVFTGWFNGVACDTADVSTVTTTLKITQNPGVTTQWIGVGANPHGGTPELDDETGEDYPNNGWFNGYIDDVRIYDRVLSSDEIANLAGLESDPNVWPYVPDVPPNRIWIGVP